MVSGSLALLYFLLGFHGGRQGSGPDRGQKILQIKQKSFGPLLHINKHKKKPHRICVFCFLLDLHIAVDEFYLFYLRRALIFAQKKF